MAGEFVVRLREGWIPARLAGTGIDPGPGFRVVREMRRPGVAPAAASLAVPRFVLVATGSNVPTTTALARLAGHPAVLYAEANGVYRVCPNAPGPRIPDDFRFPEQWSLDNRGQSDGTSGADIRAALAWGIATGNPAVRVAIVDTGIDYFHPDLEANVWVNPGEIPGNGIDDDDNGFVDDVHGYDFVNGDGDPLDDQMHGTHVAGIVGAVGNNGVGVSGVAWHASLMAIKAFNGRGEATLFDVLESISYAVANGARVLNASWMSPEKSRALGDAIAAAHGAGLLVIAAAGNDRTDVVGYPAAYPESIAVAATNNRDRRSLFSNYGPHVVLAAPGESILSTVPDNRYDVASGTSMAAPHVTGIAALVLGVHPDLENTAVEDILRSACDPLDNPEYIGLGRANAAKAVRAQPPFPTARLRVPAVLAGVVDLQGTAASPRFAGFSIEYGRGVYPTQWTLLHATNRPVEDGLLLRAFSTAVLAEGDGVLRLTVRDGTGQEACDRASVAIRNVALTGPAHNDVLRAGDLLPIEGTVFGPGRRYTVEVGAGWNPGSWSSAGIRLVNDGQIEVLDGLLATWDTRAARTNEFYTVKVTASSASGVVGESLSHLVYLDGALRPGWPRYVPVSAEYATNDWRHVTVADLDRDGQEEVIAVEPGTSEGKPARLLVFEPDGSLRWTRTLASGAPYADIPVAGDLDGDGQEEVLVDVGTPGALYAFRADGSALGGGWPVFAGAHGLGKTLADLDGDGRLEVIALGASDDPADGVGGVLLTIDAQGRVLNRWGIGGCTPDVDVPRSAPAAADLDEDPDLEIVVVEGCTGIAVFDPKHPGGPVWEIALSGAIYGSPAIGDLNGDGRLEIVVGLYDVLAAGRPGTHGGVAVLDRHGRLVPGWPVRVDESFASTPALGDLDGDGRPEIVIPSWNSRFIHVLAANGFEPAGWPVGPIAGAVLRSSPVLGDINGDGHAEVVLVCPGLLNYVASSGALGYVSGVKAWDWRGRLVDLNPRADQTALVMESSGGNRLKAAQPVLSDLDGNGRLDIVATTVEDRTFPPTSGSGRSKSRFTIYAWEIDAAFDRAASPWRMFQRDPQHSGLLPSPKATNHPPVLTAVPSQTIRSGTAFFPVELDRYVEDPDSPRSDLEWGVEGAVDLQVTLTAGHVLWVGTPGPAWEGVETLRLIVRDPGGLSATNTARFAARADYEPPVAVPDTASLMEDGSIDLAVLDNDWHPRGLALSLLDFSRAEHGIVERVGPDRLRYRPVTNYFGADSFTYVVGDGADGMAMSRVAIEVLPVPDPPVAAADQVITLENTAVAIDLLANDKDPDGDPLRLVDFTACAHGSIAVTSSNVVRYQPNAHWAGTDRFTYRVADPGGLMAEAAVTIQVKPVNESPVARDLSFTLNRNTQVDVVFAGVDPDGDTLTYQVVTGPVHGELWNYPDLATYYPKRGYSGTDSFTYTASDGEFASPPATVSFVVRDANNPPVPKGLEMVTRGGRALPILLEASDADGDPVTFDVVERPVHGTIEGTNAVLAYWPEPGYLGDDEFSFLARDASGSGQPGLVRLHVTDRNTAPVAQTYTLHVPSNQATNLTLWAIDGENDPLTFNILTRPVHGRLDGDAPNFRFSPNPGYLGPDKIVFTAGDDQFTSEPGTVSLWIYPPNRAPSATNTVVQGFADVPLALALPAADGDGNPLRSAILDGPRHGRVFGLGTNYTYLPSAGYVGPDRFTFRVWDGLAYSPIGEVSVILRSPGPVVPPRFEAVKWLGDGRVQVRLHVTPGLRLDLEGSSDLAVWSRLTSVVPFEDTLLLIDANAADQSRRYYRAVSVAP
jgi:subtilisin family serine protease